jgi:hypothetical protein
MVLTIGLSAVPAGVSKVPAGYCRKKKLKTDTECRTVRIYSSQLSLRFSTVLFSEKYAYSVSIPCKNS